MSLFLLTCLITVAIAQTPAPPGVNVKLTFAENKTVYRIGEPIKVVMEFTADREGYVVDLLPDDNQPGSDTVAISPDIGITRWYDELSDNSPYGRHIYSSAKLTSTPKRVEIFLNDRLRFDSPGRYTVSVTTRRVSRGTRFKDPLSTNSISFKIESMSEADEAKEVKRLSDLLDAKRDSQTDHVISQHLSYLTGEPSTREKIRRFLNPEQRGGNYGSHIWYGLFIARNRALVLKLLENALRDSNVPVTSQILTAVTRLKTLLTHGVQEKGDVVHGRLEPPEHPRAREIRDEYVAELAAGLAKRTGENQTTTAVTILTVASADSQTASVDKREALWILAQQFDTLDPFLQEWLLRAHWEAFRASAVPALKQMLAMSGIVWTNIRATALTRLMEIAPDEARSYAIAEILDPTSPLDPKILSALEDKSLPEADAALLEQVRRATASPMKGDPTSLKFKLDLLVRFATESIYPEVMELYATRGVNKHEEIRARLLAYLAKHNEREAIPLIEQAVSELKPHEHPRILIELTEVYYSDSIGVIVKKLLETDNYAHVSHAAYLIGKYGVAGDERVLEARLKRWRDEWRDRAVEADDQHQGQIEHALISALINGRQWKLAPERVQELKESCVTRLCKQSNLAQ